MAMSTHKGDLNSVLGENPKETSSSTVSIEASFNSNTIKETLNTIKETLTLHLLRHSLNVKHETLSKLMYSNYQMIKILENCF